MKNEIKEIIHTPTCTVCQGHCWVRDENRAKIYQVIGEASMCWSETPKGTFDSEKANKIAEQLIKDLIN